MDLADLYKDVLMDHYRRPRNHGRVSQPDAVGHGSNPLCGDELELGAKFDGDAIKQIRFRGRGCSLCLASASMMTEAVTGKVRAEALNISTAVQEWFTAGAVTPVPAELEPLATLSVVRGFPARRRCVLLAWEALDDALAAR